MRNHPLRSVAVLPAAALAVALAGCSSATPDASTTTSTTATSTTAGSSSASGSGSGTGGPSPSTSTADEYPGGAATIQVDIASEALTWSGTLEGECEPNPIAPFTTKVTGETADGVQFWTSLSLPSEGTFDSEDAAASSSLSELVVNFPAAIVGDTRPTVAGAPARVQSFTDPVHTVTFADDTGTEGTVEITRFRYPGTAFVDGTATITWTCT